jgi:hypothetical protein
MRRTLFVTLLSLTAGCGERDTQDLPHYTLEFVPAASAGNFTDGSGLAINSKGDVTGWVAEGDSNKTTFFWPAGSNSLILPKDVSACQGATAIDNQRHVYCNQEVVLNANVNPLSALTTTTNYGWRGTGVTPGGLAIETQLGVNPYTARLYRVDCPNNKCTVHVIQILAPPPDGQSVYGAAVREMTDGSWIATGWAGGLLAPGFDESWCPDTAYVWQKDKAPVAIPSLPGRTLQSGMAINSHRWIVGRTSAPDPNAPMASTTAFVAIPGDDGKYKTLELTSPAKGDTYYAIGIDDKGVIIGDSLLGNALIWFPDQKKNTWGGGHVFDDLVDKPAGCTTFRISETDAINDAGVIAGAAVCDGQRGVVRLTPLPSKVR